METKVQEPIARSKGETELVREGSWGTQTIGDEGQKWAWTMELFDIPGNAGRGYIEWDIPDADMGENIGLIYEQRGEQRALVDYDGIMSLPKEAVELLESANIIVDEEFKS